MELERLLEYSDRKVGNFRDYMYFRTTQRIKHLWISKISDPCDNLSLADIFALF